MHEVTLKSGTVIGLQAADWETVGRLRRTVFAELAKAELGAGVSMEQLMQMDVASLKNTVCGLLASEALEKCVFDCAKCCLYGEVKITRQTFEEPEARPDFYPAAWEVIKFNLAPFFANLELKSLVPTDTKGKGQQ